MISRVQKTFLLLFAAGAAAFLLLPCLTGPDANGEIRTLSLIAFFVGCVLLFLPWKIPRSEGGTERAWRLLLRLPVLLFPFVLVAVSFKGFFLFVSPEAEGIFLPLFWGLCLGSLLFSVLGGLAHTARIGDKRGKVFTLTLPAILEIAVILLAALLFAVLARMLFSALPAEALSGRVLAEFPLTWRQLFPVLILVKLIPDALTAFAVFPPPPPL